MFLEIKILKVAGHKVSQADALEKGEGVSNSEKVCYLCKL